jgi:hypothetical protein
LLLDSADYFLRLEQTLRRLCHLVVIFLSFPGKRTDSAANSPRLHETRSVRGHEIGSRCAIIHNVFSAFQEFSLSFPPEAICHQDVNQSVAQCPVTLLPSVWEQALNAGNTANSHFRFHRHPP